MLTRSQVARRLGKSVATVRRLEGVELYPRRDWRGGWQFSEVEADGLRKRNGEGASGAGGHGRSARGIRLGTRLGPLRLAWPTWKRSSQPFSPTVFVDPELSQIFEDGDLHASENAVARDPT
jgi:hypothetical protein